MNKTIFGCGLAIGVTYFLWQRKIIRNSQNSVTFNFLPKDQQNSNIWNPASTVILPCGCSSEFGCRCHNFD